MNATHYSAKVDEIVTALARGDNRTAGQTFRYIRSTYRSVTPERVLADIRKGLDLLDRFRADRRMADLRARLIQLEAV